MLGAALVFSPYWQNNRYVGAGIFISFVILPTYVLKLSEKVLRHKQELEEHAQLLHTETRTDSLTGLLNRVGLMDILNDHVQDPARGALLFIDLDGFKAVNNEAGHQAGDGVLLEVARLLRICVRRTDSCARLGGDEFAVSVRQLSNPQDVQQIAEKIIRAISKIQIADFEHLRIGASIGICELPSAQPMGVDGIVAKADQLMYQAKRAGKGRYVIG